ncbi:MAG: hypothetical protein HZC41_01940 [Chloroflexi bacterium]|nr:hypothetical protein [Chloroflexota bacterium]
MWYDDLLEEIEAARPRRKPRGSDRASRRRMADYLYEAFEDYQPRQSRRRYADWDEREDDRRDRRRDPHWKRYRKE